MRRRIPIALAVAGATTAALLGASSPAPASEALQFSFLAYSGGTQVQALNNTVTSALTAASTIQGSRLPDNATNTLASANVANLATVGAVATDVHAAPISGGVSLTAHAKVANVTALNGLIKIGAVETTAVTTYVDGVPASTSGTTFADIQVANARIPITVPKNFHVTIPGVANVVLNLQYPIQGAAGTVTMGAGVYITLLKAQGNSPAGTQIILNPTYAAIGFTNPQSGPAIGGSAYATKITAQVGTTINVSSDPTVPISLPGGGGGTGGKTLTNSIATVDVGSILHLGAITTSATGSVNADSSADASTSTKIVGLNVLGGLIKADAIYGTASVHRNAAGMYSSSGQTQLLNLVIAGKAIPVNVGPNTQIHVANLGLVTINGQSRSANASQVRLLTIVLDTATLGLPVGAEIDLGFAQAFGIG